ncbi:Transmembrane 4 L6 family member 1, partial [Camelus dromedarius]
CKDPEPAQKLPAAELEDSASLAGPGCLAPGEAARCACAQPRRPGEIMPVNMTATIFAVGGFTMCSETGSRCTGMLLLTLATTAIIANLLLYFPNGQVLAPAKVTNLVWFFHGFLGAGLLVMVPAVMLLRAGGEGCWAHRRGVSTMLFPVLLAILGTMGAVYCVVISSLGLLSGPFCDTGSGNYTYPFRNDTLENSYLFNRPSWTTCQEPEHIVLWHVVLFSILLGIGAVEAALCLSQAVSGLCDIFCGTCIRKGQVTITGL